MRKILFMAIIMVCSVCLSSVFVYGEEITGDTIELESVLANEASLKVVVRIIKPPAGYPYTDTLLWGGDQIGEDEYELPETLIQSIDVRINDKKIDVPLSAYQNIGGVDNVSIEITERGFILIIMGYREGDMSYKSMLEFDTHKILRKKVFLKVFPDEVWEETFYSFHYIDEDK